MGGYRRARGEQGQVLILFVLIFSLILLAAMLTIDFGSWQSDRRTAQKDADAAVYAGAFPLAFERTSATMQSDAVNRITEWALRNGVDSADLVINPRIVQQCFATPAYDGLPDGVETEIDADTERLFGEVLNIANITVGAHAKACVGSLVTTTGLRPWAMPLEGEDLGSTCSAGSRDIGGDCVANCFEKDGDGNIVPSFGATCRIRSDEPQSIGSINLEDDDPNADCDSGSSSGAAYGENIEEGSPAACSIGDIVGTKQGMTVGPTLSSLTALIATEGDCDARYDDPPVGTTDLADIDDFWESFSPADAVPGPDTVYTARECDDDPADLVGEPDTPRFVTIAVVQQLPTASGTQPVEILAFAGFYIERCEKLDNGGNYVASPPLDEAKCDLDPPVSRFQIVGRFIQFQMLGGTAGALNPFGTKVIILVE